MKATFFYLALMTTSLMLVVPSEAKIHTIDLKTAMGIWLLDENTGTEAKDISGNDNHGKIQGAKWVKGKFGSALKFNGSTDRVVIPNSDSLYAKKAWTITSWIFVNKSEVGYGHIVGKRSGAGTNYAFRTDSKSVGWDAYFSQGGWKGAWQQGKAKKGEWVYMTATYDGENTIQIYENGVEIGKADVGKPPPQSDAEVHIGGWQDNTSELLDGLLDEVAIFNVALSPADMKALMKNGFEAIGNTTNVTPMNKLATSWADIKSQ